MSNCPLKSVADDNGSSFFLKKLQNQEDIVSRNRDMEKDILGTTADLDSKSLDLAILIAVTWSVTAIKKSLIRLL